MNATRHVCYQCGAPATHSARYGGNDRWREYSCDEHTLPCSHWADPHAGADDVRPEPTDSEIWDAAYPDGDPYADCIHVCRTCGSVVRTTTSGGAPTSHDSLADAHADSEALSASYDGACLADEPCGDLCADVYEVAAREQLVKRADD